MLRNLQNFLLVLKINFTLTVTNSNLFYYFNMNFLKDSDLEFSEIIKKKKKKKSFSMVVFFWMIIILKLFHIVIILGQKDLRKGIHLCKYIQ